MYGDSKQKDELREQLRNNSSFIKRVNYLEKAALSAPKNISFFDELIEFGMDEFPETPNIVDWEILYELGS